jgi:hypothetical protein
MDGDTYLKMMLGPTTAHAGLPASIGGLDSMIEGRGYAEKKSIAW